VKLGGVAVGVGGMGVRHYALLGRDPVPLNATPWVLIRPWWGHSAGRANPVYIEQFFEFVVVVSESLQCEQSEAREMTRDWKLSRRYSAIPRPCCEFVRHHIVSSH